MPDIKVKNYHGEDVILENATKVYHHTPESTIENPIKVPFTYGEAVSKSVELDFSNGDTEVPIAEGELVTELTIPVPEGLVPENIAKDVEIAGIIGTLAGGGGDSSFKFATGKIKTAGAVIVNHGLGVVPDIIVVQLSAMMKGCLYYAIWFSPSLCAEIGASNSPAMYAYIDSTTGKDFYSATTENEPAIRSVTIDSFTVGSATYPAVSMLSGIVLSSSTWYALSFLN